MIAAAAAFKPDVLVVLGDYLDFWGVSQYRKTPKIGVRLYDEIADGCVGLDELDGLAERKIFCEGNHEHRLTRYLIDHAPQLFEFVELRSLLDLGERGWEFVPFGRKIRVGPWHVSHQIGNRMGKYALVNGYEATGEPVVHGHTHRLCWWCVSTMAGRVHSSMSCGWLGKTSHALSYADEFLVRFWQHGFGLGYVEGGVGHAVPVPIVNGRCLVEGKVIKG